VLAVGEAGVGVGEAGRKVQCSVEGESRGELPQPGGTEARGGMGAAPAVAVAGCWAAGGFGLG
jgi:hypothetical protein